MGDNVRLEHLIVCDREKSIFAAARDTQTRRIKLFLIREYRVYDRKNHAWEEVFGRLREDLVNFIAIARNNRSVPVFQVNSLNA